MHGRHLFQNVFSVNDQNLFRIVMNYLFFKSSTIRKKHLKFVIFREKVKKNLKIKKIYLRYLKRL